MPFLDGRKNILLHSAFSRENLRAGPLATNALEFIIPGSLKTFHIFQSSTTIPKRSMFIGFVEDWSLWRFKEDTCEDCPQCLKADRRFYLGALPGVFDTLGVSGSSA